MLRDLQAMGFQFKLVLADSLYGESASNFVDVLYQLNLNARSGDSQQSRGLLACWAKGSTQWLARQSPQRGKPPHGETALQEGFLP